MSARKGFASLPVMIACVCATLPSPCPLANPLDDHRQAMRMQSQPAYVVYGLIAQSGDDGRIVLSIPSARLMNAGVLSGDEVAIDMGGAQSWTAYVAFRDELERDIAFYAEAGKEMATDPGMTLIVDRDHPGEKVVLDASAGGGVTPRDAQTARYVSIRAIRRVVAR